MKHQQNGPPYPIKEDKNSNINAYVLNVSQSILSELVKSAGIPLIVTTQTPMYVNETVVVPEVLSM
jgi:hypothetical protein